MARCKYCGNFVEDYLYEQNNGMCNLCIRTAQGEDDPLVVRAEPEPMPAPKVVEVENPFAFKPKMFDGKSIEEYDFQGVISSEIVDCPDTKEGKALLLTTHKELFGAAEKVKAILPPVLISLLFVPFSFFPLCLFIAELTKVPFANFKLTGDNPLGFLAFSLVGFGLTFLVLWNGIVKNFWIFDWVLLKDNCIECYRGHKFNFKKSDKYYFDDIAAFYTDNDGGKGTHLYTVEISQPSTDLGLKRHAFVMDVESGIDAEYWQEFLNWYIKRNCVGGFGSATSHGQDQ